MAERWRRYFQELLNEEYENQIEECDVVEGPIESIAEEEVRTAISKMKDKRATGPCGVSAEMFKAMEGVDVKEVTAALQQIAQESRMPDSWKYSTTIALFKGKGDALACNKYRGLRFLEHGMKIMEKVLDSKLRRITNIGSSHFGFRPVKSTEDAVFIVRQLQEKYLQKKRKLYHVFVDLEKAFDQIPRRAIEWALRRQLIPVGGLSNRGWGTPGFYSEPTAFHPGHWGSNKGVRRRKHLGVLICGRSGLDCGEQRRGEAEVCGLEANNG